MARVTHEVLDLKKGDGPQHTEQEENHEILLKLKQNVKTASE